MEFKQLLEKRHTGITNSHSRRSEYGTYGTVGTQLTLDAVSRRGRPRDNRKDVLDARLRLGIHG